MRDEVCDSLQTRKGKKAWRVSIGKRGKDLLSFRVRPSSSGYFVAWRSGNSERYVCYLAAAEWQTARKGSPASFAQLVTAKLDARQAAGEPLDKIAGLQNAVRAFHPREAAFIFSASASYSVFGLSIQGR